jgi:hypothetical protein
MYKSLLVFEILSRFASFQRAPLAREFALRFAPAMARCTNKLMQWYPTGSLTILRPPIEPLRQRETNVQCAGNACAGTSMGSSGGSYKVAGLRTRHWRKRVSVCKQNVFHGKGVVRIDAVLTSCTQYLPRETRHGQAVQAQGAKAGEGEVGM